MIAKNYPQQKKTLGDICRTVWKLTRTVGTFGRHDKTEEILMDSLAAKFVIGLLKEKFFAYQLHELSVRVH